MTDAGTDLPIMPVEDPENHGLPAEVHEDQAPTEAPQ